jgi:single-stranded-DNA-specific exonuclease
LFTRFGGHAHAVGFSLPSELVPELRERMVRYAETKAFSSSQEETLDCDAEIQLNEITPEFLLALEQLGPFGIGNPEPLFTSCGVRLASALQIVKERNLRLSVQDATEATTFRAMAWSRRTDWVVMARNENWGQGDRLDLAYRLRRNWHPDFGGWELEIVAMRSNLLPKNPGNAQRNESFAS